MATAFYYDYKVIIMNNSSMIKKIVYVSLFAASIAAGAIITIPLGPVPISLQTLFVFLAALFL